VGILDHIFGSRTRSRLRPPVGAEVQERLARYVEEARAGQWTADVMPLASLEPILAASPRDQIETLHLAFAFWQEHRESLRRSLDRARHRGHRDPSGPMPGL